MARRKPWLKINNESGRITFKGSSPVVKGDKPFRGEWSFIRQIQEGTLYIKNMNYNQYSKGHKKSLVRFRNFRGEIEKDILLKYGVYRLSTKPNSRDFLVRSDDNVLHKYDHNCDCIQKVNLDEFAFDKYQIRCVDFIPDTGALLFTSMGIAYFSEAGEKPLSISPKDNSSWLYSCWLENRDSIWLGTHSGRIFHMSSTGESLRTIKTLVKEPIRSLFIQTPHILIQQRSGISIFKNDKRVTTISVREERYKLLRIVKGDLFLQSGKKEFTLFLASGQVIGSISLDKPVYDVYWANDELCLSTYNTTYRFHVFISDHRFNNASLDHTAPILDQHVETVEETVVVSGPSDSSITMKMIHAQGEGILAEVFPFEQNHDVTIRVVRANGAATIEIGPIDFMFDKFVAYPWDEEPAFVKAEIFAFALELAASHADSIDGIEKSPEQEFFVVESYQVSENPVLGIYIDEGGRESAASYKIGGNYGKNHPNVPILGVYDKGEYFSTPIEHMSISDTSVAKIFSEGLKEISMWISGQTVEEEEPLEHGYDDLDLADQALDAGNIDEAASYFKSVFNKNISANTKALVLRYLGERAESEGETLKAIKRYQQALANNPKVGVNKNLAALLSSLDSNK